MLGVWLELEILAEIDRRVAELQQGRVEKIHQKLDQFAQRYCPVIVRLEASYHWSLDQTE